MPDDPNASLITTWRRNSSKANPTALDPTSPTEKGESREGGPRESALRSGLRGNPSRQSGLREGTSREGTSREGTSREGTSREDTSREGRDQGRLKAPPTYSAVLSGAERKKTQDIQKPEEDEEMTEKPSLDDFESGGALIDLDTEPLENQKQRARAGGHPGHRQSTGRRLGVMRIGDSSNSHKARLADLTVQHKDLNLRFFEAEAACREKDMKIKVLTETITRLHLKDGGLVKDDSYFSTNFSDIANSIVEWTMRHFRSKSKIAPKFEDLPVELRNLVMHAAPTGENPLIVKGTRLRVISSIVIENLYGRLFCGPLPGAMDACNFIQMLTPQLQGSDFQMQRWRALTNTLITQSDDYERKFGIDIARITESISQLISALVPPESDAGLRNTELYKLVERASRVAIEVRKQLDVITLNSPRPGTLFSGKTMEDLSCENGLEELEAGRATVHIPLCPAIMRRSCDPDGSLSPAPGELVMKAKVTTTLVDSS